MDVIKRFLLNLCGFIVIMSPWWIRNFVVLKKVILLSTQEDHLLRGTYLYYVGVENYGIIYILKYHKKTGGCNV